MNILEFQRELREISDRYLRVAMECHVEISTLVEIARRSAEHEPELYLAVAEAEGRRIDRLLSHQEEATLS